MAFWLRLVLAATALSLGLAGCSRDDEGALWARLDRWFEVEEAVYFKSRFRCTVAIYRVADEEPRASFPVQRDLRTAKQQFRMGQRAAISMRNFSPHDIADALLLSGDGVFGRDVLAAAAQAGPCFKDTMAEARILGAMTRRGALLAYDRESEGLILLDPGRLALFYIAGDVW